MFTSSIEEALSHPMMIDPSLEDIPVDAFNEPIDVLGVAVTDDGKNNDTVAAAVSGEEEKQDGEIAGPSRIPSSRDLNQQHGDDDDDAAVRLGMAFDRETESSTPTSRICKYTFTPPFFTNNNNDIITELFLTWYSLSLSLSNIISKKLHQLLEYVSIISHPLPFSNNNNDIITELFPTWYSLSLYYEREHV